MPEPSRPEPSGYVTPGQPNLPGADAPAPTGQLVLELRPPVGLIRGSISPVVTIDGQQVSAQWHTNVFTVPAGSRHIVVQLPYMRHSGYAQFAAQMQPGQRTVVHYAAPASMHHRGAMGYTAPRSGAALIVLLVVGGMLLLTALLVVGVIIWVLGATPG